MTFKPNWIEGGLGKQWNTANVTMGGQEQSRRTQGTRNLGEQGNMVKFCKKAKGTKLTENYEGNTRELTTPWENLWIGLCAS